MFDAVRKLTSCPACGGWKLPGALFCAPCFPKYHAMGGVYTPEAMRLASVKNDAIGDDPHAAVFDDDWDQMERDLGIKW